MNINSPSLVFKDIQGTNNPKSIILHHALHPSCSIMDIHIWHLNNGWCGCGYHYFIRRDGQIWRGRPENKPGAHCKESSMNFNSIGICLEGCYEFYIPKGGNKNIGQKDGPTDRQLEALEWLCFDIMKRYKLTYKNIKPHSYHANYKKCPGDYWNYYSFIAGLNKAIPIDIPIEEKKETWQDKIGKESIALLNKHGIVNDVEDWNKKNFINAAPLWLVFLLASRIVELIVKKDK